MRQLLLATVLLIGLTTSGCATMFSGTSQHVRIRSNVEDTSCVVLGGYVGSVLATASKVSDVAQAVFDVLDPWLDPKDREALRKIDINEVIAYVGVRAVDAEMPPAMKERLAFIQQVPDRVIRELLDLFAVMDYGSLPRKVELKRARTYAVVAWADGYKARVEVIGVRPNFVTLWNILNFGLGFIIDFLTGAWSNLEDPIEFELVPLPAALGPDS